MKGKLRILAALVLALMVIALPAFAQEVDGAVEEPVFNLAWVGYMVGFFLPLVVSAVKQNQWTRTVKQGVALVVAAIAGIVQVGVQGGWEFDENFLQLVLFSIPQIWITAQVAYKGFWEDTTPEVALANAGSSTNKASPPPS